MITGYSPFIKNNSTSSSKNFISVTNSQIQDSEKLSPQLKNLISGLLNSDPEKRLGSS
jgi:serine/threonine protein kinase